MWVEVMYLFSLKHEIIGCNAYMKWQSQVVASESDSIVHMQSANNYLLKCQKLLPQKTWNDRWVKFDSLVI